MMRLLVLLSALLTALASVGGGSSALAAPAHQTLSLVERVAARRASAQTGRRPAQAISDRNALNIPIGHPLPVAITARRPLGSDRLRV